MRSNLGFVVHKYHACWFSDRPTGAVCILRLRRLDFSSLFVNGNYAGTQICSLTLQPILSDFFERKAVMFTKYLQLSFAHNHVPDTMEKN